MLRATCADLGIALGASDKLLVCFYRDHRQYLRIAGSGASTQCCFRFTRPAEFHFYYDRHAPEASRAALRWGIAHNALRLHLPGVLPPAFLSSGIAEVYAGSRWIPETSRFGPRVENPTCRAMLEALKPGGPMSLERLFEFEVPVNRSCWVRGLRGIESDPWAWSFCRFVLCSEKYRRGFRVAIGALRDAATVDDRPRLHMRRIESGERLRILRESLGEEDFEELEARWHDHIRKMGALSPREHLELARILDSYSSRTAALERYEAAIEAGCPGRDVLFECAQLLYRQERYSEAADRLREAARARSTRQLGLSPARQGAGALGG